MSRKQFVDHFGHLYESSPWIAEAVYDDGVGPELDQPEGLLQRFREALEAAPPERQLELIRAHPELAGPPASALTENSRAEQSSARLDRLDDGLRSKFADLNRRYRERFGFPFVVAVRGLDADGILARFEQRLNHTPEQEFTEAMRQIHRIARLRLGST